MDYVAILSTTLLVVNWVSVALSAALCLTYAVFKRNFPHLSVFLFALCSCGLSIALLIGPLAGVDQLAAQRSICVAQGFLIQFFAIMVIGIDFCIVLLLLSIVVLRDVKAERLATRVVYRCMFFLCPVIALLTAVLATVLGDGMRLRGPWCWVTPNPAYVEMIYFYGPMGAIAIISCFIWAAIVWHLRKLRAELSMDSGRSPFVGLYRHIVFCGVFLLIFLLMFGHRLYNAITNTDLFVLELIHAIALGGVGIWTSAIFLFSKHNMSLWADFFADCRRGGSNRQHYRLVNEAHASD